MAPPPLTIVYSFNKKGFEAEFWTREIAAASNDRYRFVPFNHDDYLDVRRYARAQALDNLYFDREAGLLRMYDDLQATIAASGAQALIVDNYCPYHPDWLKRLAIYKVLRTSDGPLASYDRDFAYLHAYDHVLYHSPAHSPELTMAEKLDYCGAKRHDFWPLAVWDAHFDAAKSETDILVHQRDIDIIFIGTLVPNKMPLLAKVKKVFGARAHFAGRNPWKYNAYFKAKYRVGGWLSSVTRADFMRLYQRAKIGINVHNRGQYTVGSFRMFDLPANGVMQISDGGKYLDSFFEVGREIEGYDDADQLVRKIRHYLDHDDERRAVAAAGFRRTMRDHRMRLRLQQAGEIIERGMQR
jgi:spore maturation protein CgeB